MKGVSDVSEHCVWSSRRRAILEGVRNKCLMIKTWNQALVAFWAVKMKIMRKAKTWSQGMEFLMRNLPV